MRALAVYKGTVSHARTHPKTHFFSYSMTQVWIDIQQLNLLDDISPFWSSSKPNLVSFRNQNHLPCESSQDLDLYQRVAKQVHAHTGNTFDGKAYLLANLNVWGYCFNPVAFIFCYENDELRYLIAEVQNTPWKERSIYFHNINAQLRNTDKQGYFTAKFEKKFHVSPFMPMGMQYHWNYRITNDGFQMQMKLSKGGQAVFRVTVDLNGQPLSSAQANLMPFRYPLIGLKVISAIYWQGLKLWLKNIPIYPHTTSK